eukprot:3674875-Pyramimonas_sp.AAC.1
MCIRDRQLHGCGAGRVQHVARAVAPHISVLHLCQSFTDEGQVIINRGPSPQRSAPSSCQKCRSFADGGEAPSQSAAL